MKKHFRMACSLWINPDLSGAEAGLIDPPFVNHTKLDFLRLLKALDTLFPHANDVNYRIANDTIDPITLQIREAMSLELLRCREFGERLLDCARKQKGDIINVRDQWSDLHFVGVNDRDNAPPPAVIAFVVESNSFEDAMDWLKQSNLSLGRHPFICDHRNKGYVTPEFLSEVGDIFGCSFYKESLVDKMASD